MTDDEAVSLVWKILGGMPVEVFDEDDGSVWENTMWELVRPRPEGDYAGTRAIGSANLITALNMLHQKLLIKNNDPSADAMKTFNQVMTQLQEKRLIRRKPEKVRETFKIIQVFWCLAYNTRTNL